MRPKMKIEVPKHGPSEFKNFDRLVGILLKAKRRKPTPKIERDPERPATGLEATQE
jgi:hypothetical protein